MPEATLAGAGRIAGAFGAARAEGRAALMPYMMAGYPDRESSLAIAAAYADSGADLIELGVPFSDPLADGPTIHAAATAALAAGATFATALEVCRSVSERLPGRLHGLREHAARARGRRSSSPGSPPPRAPPARSSRTCPSASPRRSARRSTLPGWPWCRWSRRPRPPSAAPGSAPSARGFVYVVSTVGTTGERDELPPGLAELVSATKADSEVPVAVGFGIGTPRQAAQVGEVADGVIVGSRLVRAAGEGGSPEAAADAVSAFLSETRVALAG